MGSDMKRQLDEVLGSTSDGSVNVPLGMVRTIADEQPYYKYNQIWSKHMENVSFCYVLKYYIAEERLLTYEEVAEALDQPVGTVKSNVHRGLKLLRGEHDDSADD